MIKQLRQTVTGSLDAAETARRIKLLAIGVLVGCLLLVGTGIGMVSAQEASHDVTIETDEPLVEGENTTVQVTIEENTGDDMIFPLVEVPLDDFNISEDRLSPRGDGTVEVDGVTVKATGEERLAYLDDSTFRDGKALFIEGEELSANSKKTFEFDMTVETASETTLEADFRPLNAESNNVRTETTVDPTAAATINASFSQGSGTIAVGEQSDSDSLSTKVAGGSSYEVSADISILPEPLSLNVTPEEYATEIVSFTGIAAGEAAEPTVVARTGSKAEVIDGSTAQSLNGGNATANTTLDIEFDLVTSNGETRLVTEEPGTTPIQGVAQTGDFSNVELVPTDDGDVAVMAFNGSINDLVSVGFEGYKLGDATLDNTVGSDDASEVATALAAGDQVTDYADVTGDSEISVADAMQIKQYDAGNRTADYEVSN